jgi:CBS domain-containing protein
MAKPRGIGSNLAHIRKRYGEMTGEDWPGIDYHLSVLVKSSTKLSEVLNKMGLAGIPSLPDDPNARPLGSVSDADLLAEIAKRPKLFS